MGVYSVGSEQLAVIRMLNDECWMLNV